MASVMASTAIERANEFLAPVLDRSNVLFLLGECRD